ncbi:ABC transporter permease [Paenibacillus sp. XY044]|uniref:ABC transporter permease n=1 Tax=Paenibacillus sp. XY044 TaxID=2026089 RepID=UPI000B97E053|nr:ABC transporter permease [Paenibacillus sp. XY044]OZB98345.1 ABC transporter permease [Paenibacillus sp. XY044]
MRLRALISRICRQMLRDKRTLALLLLAPLLVLTLMYFLFNSKNTEPKLGVNGLDTRFVQVLKQTGLTVTEYDRADPGTVLDDKLDALLNSANGKLTLTLENSDPGKAKQLQMKVSQAAASAAVIQQPTAGLTPSPEMETHYIYGSSDSDFFDVLSPILIGFFVFFFVFLISGIGLLRERTTGTLERLMSTPIRRGEVVAGYLTGYGIFAVIQTLIVVLYAVGVLDITLAGSIWLVLLVNLLLALVALSLGILLSTFASSEFQMVQFIPVVVIPQVFFAGIFPQDGMADWLRVVGYIMPLHYGADALKNVMYKGEGLAKIGLDLTVLTFFAGAFILLNIFALKKYRKL